jgi:hypothetical protein
MIVYSVTVTIKKETEADWLKWMKDVHIKDVMKTGCFLRWEIKKLLYPEDAVDESTYIISYFLNNIELYNQYLTREAPRLQREHTEKFSGKFRASRAVYRILPE